MKYLPLILVCVIGCLHTSSSEKRHAHDREFARNIEEWVASPAGEQAIVQALEENIVTIMVDEFGRDGIFSGLIILLGGWGITGRVKKHAKEVRA